MDDIIMAILMCVLKMKFYKKIIFIISLLITSSYSFADIESGTYVIGNVGYGFVSNNTVSHYTNNNSYALGVNFGYAFNKYLAIDAQTTFMPNSSYGVVSNYFLSSAALKAGVPIGDFFSAYIHIGPGLLTDSSSGSNQFGLFTGLGGIFKLNQSWGINVEDYGIFLPDNNANNINIFAVGAVYGF